ncbi:MAG: hypothetical protein ACRDJK_10775, partial [Actinomycetota bacterium]
RLNVRLDTLERLAKGLEMTVWELLRVAEVGGGSTETHRPVGGRPRGPQFTQYKGGPAKPAAESPARRKVAENRER